MEECIMKSDKAEVKERIVVGVIDEFNKRGPSLRLDDVSRSLHISKKTIYRYFKSKDAIIAYIGEAILEEIKKSAMDIYNSDIPTLEKINKILEVDAYYETLFDRKHGRYYKDTCPHIDSYIEKKTVFLCDLFEKLVIKGKEEGVIRSDVPTMFVKNVLTSLMHSFSSGLLLDSIEMEPEEARRFLISLLMDGTSNRK